jgi:CheY-like chemotaxis protein
LMMPQMDGFAVCGAIRAMPAGRNIPDSGGDRSDDVESTERAYRIGANESRRNWLRPTTKHGRRVPRRRHSLKR